MQQGRIVSHDEWLKARLELLAAEKALKGREEGGLRHPMEWLHRHDQR